LERVGDVVALLRHADPDERREFYQELGLRLAYQRPGEQEKIRASLGVEFSRVGGGTRYKTPRRVAGTDLWLWMPLALTPARFVSQSRLSESPAP
jgi:catechol 2,3-dioxygenase-like lactoylglutathione lyase family enzyme